MKRIAFIVCIIFCFILGFIGCKHESIVPTVTPNLPGGVNPGGPPPGNGGGGTPVSTLVCFEIDILPIFQTNCAKSGCHDAGSHQEDYVLDNYNNIVRRGIEAGDASDSEIYEVLFENGEDKMPRPPNPDLTPAQKALIGKWINEGAKNTVNCNVGTSGCDITKFNFSADIKPILATNCTGCHGGTAPSGGINLTVYDVVKQVGLNGRLVGAITHAPGFQPMPRNANKLSDCKITQIQKWIDAGAQDN